MRHSVFTINNYKKIPEKIPDSVRYLIFGIEKGEKEQTPHLQGYIEMKKTCSLNMLKNLDIPGFDKAHFEKRKGTREEARAYCMKDGKFTEFGEWITGQGHRSDLVGLRDRAKRGVSIKQIIEEMPHEYARFSRFYKEILLLYPPNRENVEVMLILGATGTGKTRWAYEAFKEDMWATPLGGFDWFDGYVGQKTVLMDDFAGRSSKVELTHLLRLLDRYVLQVPIKGGFTWFNPDRIIITSNIHPRKWYDYSERQEHYYALKRRIHYAIRPIIKDGESDWEKFDLGELDEFVNIRTI